MGYGAKVAKEQCLVLSGGCFYHLLLGRHAVAVV